MQNLRSRALGLRGLPLLREVGEGPAEDQVQKNSPRSRSQRTKRTVSLIFKLELQSFAFIDYFFSHN